MGYNREIYRQVAATYDGKYLKAWQEANMRAREVQLAIPELVKLDRDLAAVGPEIMLATMSSDKAALQRAKKKNQELICRKKALLLAGGYPEDYTEVKYECEKCSDTGFVDGKMCECMRRRLVEAGIERSGMSALIANQGFDNFSLGYYQTPESGKRMKKIYDIMYNFAENFEPKQSPNIALFGGTGLGKTHLSSAVARRVIERGYDVYYAGAISMCSEFEKQKFSNVSPGAVDTERIYGCDLLIIDDLGAEFSSQYTTSVIYDVINVRINNHRPTILSTNLTPEDFRKKYWDRITSRVFGEFLVLPFLGTDIRSLKIGK